MEVKDFLPVLADVMSDRQATELNPLVLAFVGDSVHTLFVRTQLVFSSSAKTNELHRRASMLVKAESQARAAETLADEFTEEELAVFKRARNSKMHTTAKNANVIDYRKASGLEAVIGYLYLTGRHERLIELLRRGENAASTT